MGTESFNWKSLFINDEKNQPKNVEYKPTSFPQTTGFPETNLNTNSTNNISNPFLEEILQVYQNGFDGLNVEGFDFFEMFKSVNAVGVTNPQSYQMAFTMGKTISPNLTKEYLLEKAKYYLTEIEKVYEKYNITGNSKKSDLSLKVTTNKQNLTKEIADIESQILQLQKQLQVKSSALNQIDNDNAAEFSELQLKLEANNMAKHKIQDSINLVVTGINQYL